MDEKEHYNWFEIAGEVVRRYSWQAFPIKFAKLLRTLFLTEPLLSLILMWQCVVMMMLNFVTFLAHVFGHATSIISKRIKSKK